VFFKRYNKTPFVLSSRNAAYRRITSEAKLKEYPQKNQMNLKNYFM
jgi:hypothetical protein